MPRPTWDEYFMSMVELVKVRSTCLRRQVGAVIVKDKRILSTGYNGAPMGCMHCGEIGCIREQMKIPSGERHELCRAIHAEQNAIVQAAYSGVSIAGATLYTSLIPCSLCAKMIINAGIKKVVCKGKYADTMTIPLFREAGVRLINLDKEDECEEEWVAINEDTIAAITVKPKGCTKRAIVVSSYDVIKAIAKDELHINEKTIQITPLGAAEHFIKTNDLDVLKLKSVDEWRRLL